MATLPHLDQLSLDEQVCVKCGLSRPRSDFRTRSDRPDKVHITCRPCENAAKRAWGKKNRERTNATARAWREKNRERSNANNLRYRNRNLEKRREANRAWQEKNREYTRAFHRNWLARHRDQQRAYTQKLRTAHPAKFRAWGANWRASRPDYKRRYVATHPGYVVAIEQRRRARKRGNGGSYTPEEFIDLCARYGDRCLACGATDRPLTVDHVVPISKGGRNDIGNIQPLCMPCNLRKHVKTIDYRPVEVEQ